MSKAKSENVWVAHLLRRAGFGFNPSELKYYQGRGYERTLSELLKPEKVDNDKLEAALAEQQFDFFRVPDLQRWWIYRMAFTRRPLEEKMTLFWHGHFATSYKKSGDGYSMYMQNTKMRALGLGNFETLLLAMSEDPAMIDWLDNSQNRKGKPNENYAREVMELFTVGIGNYSEQDVKEGARAFTGWMSKPDGFFFNIKQHDFGAKTFLGQTGNFNGNDVVDRLAHEPATAKFLAKKLCKFFVSDSPSETIVEDVAVSYKPGEKNISKMLETIFTHSEFISMEAYHAKIKSPAELVVGTIKSMQITKLDGSLPEMMARMGQDLLAPPNVKGWDGGKAWISTDMMMERFNFAAKMSQEKFDLIKGYITPSALIADQGLRSPEATVAYFLNLLVDNDVPESTRNELIAYFMRDNKGKPMTALDDKWQDAKLRGLVHLIMTVPTYQYA
jgi:uncharacterized protein (DUF1800 family)